MNDAGTGNPPLDALRHHVSGAVARGDAEPIVEVPVTTQELSVSLMLTVRIKAPIADCDGRPYNAEHLAKQVEQAIWEDMPYEPEDREPTDLVQEVLSVEMHRVGAVNVQS